MWIKPVVILFLVCSYSFSPMTFAQQQTTAKEAESKQITAGEAAREREAEAEEQPEEAPEGLLPIPEYGGDVRKREFLTSDWDGKRTEWAAKLTLDVQWLQSALDHIDNSTVLHP